MSNRKIISKGGRILYFCITLLSAILAICSCIQTNLAKKLLDEALLLDWNAMKHSVFMLVLIIGVLLLVEMVRKIMLIEFERSITNQLQDALMKGIFALSFSKIEKQNHENYMSIFNNDLKEVISDYYLEMISYIYSILNTVCLSGFLFYIHPWIAMIVIVSNILPMIIPLFFSKGLQVKKEKYLNSVEKLNVRLSDGIRGFFVLKVHDRKAIYEEIIRNTVKCVTGEKVTYQKYNAVCEMLIGFFAYLSYIVIIVGGVTLIYNDKLTAGGLLAAITVSDMLVDPVTNVAYQANTINAIREVRDKILNICMFSDKKQSGQTLAQPISKIEIKGLSYVSEEKEILKDLNIVFERGKKYLICGENGSGKSTLFKILAKQNDYTGSILVNGMELRNISETSYYHALGFASQKPFMFNDTLENNIRIFQKSENKNLGEILGLCQAENLLNDMDDEKNYHDGKENLSGGEIQKLSLARLVYDDKYFQIWDEATSALDKQSSYQVEERMLKDSKMTLIHIQHMVKEELLPLYDEVLYMIDGKLVHK